MATQEIFDKLKLLQGVLSEKYDIENKVESLPQSLDSSIEGLTQFKSEFLAKNTECEEEKAKLESLKAELAETTKLAEEGEKGMDAIETHREYEILNKQIEEAKAREGELRTQIDKEEKKLAEINDDLNNLEVLINSTEAQVNEEKAALDENIEGLKAQLKDLEKQEGEISEGVETEILYKFQRIIKRNTKGIVAVKGNVCDGCQMILPSQFANEVRKGESILFCPYCSRILYYEESEDTEENYFTIEETGSLADFADDEDLLDGDEDSVEDRLDDEDSSDIKMDYEDN